MKKCPKCEETKPLDDFHRCSAKPDGRISNCKKCVSEYAKKYRAENAEHRSKLGKDYYQRDKERKKARTAERIARYKEEYERLDITVVTKACNKCGEVKTLEFFSPRATARDGRRADCKACGAAHKARKTAENPQKRRDDHKKWRDANKDKVAGYNRKWNEERASDYERERRANDPLWRIRKNVSCAVYSALSERRSSKDGQSTFAHLPYTTQQLKEHIESQFEDWMTWDNWGMIGEDKRTWNIDHIYPHSKFQYESLEDEVFRLCWSLENLRPLEATENVSKKDSIIVEFEDIFGCEKPEKVA